MQKNYQIQRLILLSIGLFLSGGSGLINQVIWQRKLKSILGGADAISSTIVILVFMLGLGLGSYFTSLHITKVKRPIRMFAIVELLLAVVTCGICVFINSSAISSALSSSIIEKFSTESPLLFLSLASFCILFIPCFLMGTTVPLASEICQKSLQIKKSNILSLIFVSNTIGSVTGSLLAGSIMIPYIGLAAALYTASAINFVAAITLFILGKNELSVTDYQSTPVNNTQIQPTAKSYGYILMFATGFISLAYEMYLFRLFAVMFTPVPQTFAAVVGGFLIFWTLGSLYAGGNKGPNLKAAFLANAAALIIVFWACLSDINPLLNLHSGSVVIFSIIIIPALLFYIIWNLFHNQFQYLNRKILISTVFIIALISGVTLTAFLENRIDGYDIPSLILFIFSKSIMFLPCFFFGYCYTKLCRNLAQSWGKDIAKLNVCNTIGSCCGIVGITYIGYEIDYIYGLIGLLLFIIAIGLFSKNNPSLSRQTRLQKSAIMTLATLGICCFIIPLTFNFKVSHKHFARFSSKGGDIKVTKGGDMIWDGLWHSALSDGSSHIGTKNWYLSVIPAICHNNASSIQKVCIIGNGTGITASTFSKMESVDKVIAYDINKGLIDIYKAYPSGTLNILDNKKIEIRWKDARFGLNKNHETFDIIQTQPLYLKQAGSSDLNSREFLEIIKSRLNKNGIFCLYSNGNPSQAEVLRNTADDLLDSPPLISKNAALIITDDSPILEYPEYLKKKLTQQQR